MSKTQIDEQTQTQGLPFYRRVIQKGLSSLDEVGQAVSNAAKKAFSVLGNDARIDISMQVPTLTEEAYTPTADELPNVDSAGIAAMHEWAMISIHCEGIGQAPALVLAGIMMRAGQYSPEYMLSFESFIHGSPVFIEEFKLSISLPVSRFKTARVDFSKPSEKHLFFSKYAEVLGGTRYVLMSEAYAKNGDLLVKAVQEMIEKNPVAVGTGLFGVRPTGTYEDKKKFSVQRFNPVSGFYDSRYTRRSSPERDEEVYRPKLRSHERIVHFRPQFDAATLPPPRAGKTSRAKVGDLNPKGGLSVAYGLYKTGLKDHYSLTYGVSICSSNDLFSRKGGFELAVSRLQTLDLSPLSQVEVEQVMCDEKNQTRSFVECYSTVDEDGVPIPHFEGYGLSIVQLPEELILQRSDGQIELKGPAYPNQMSLAYLIAIIVAKQAEVEEHYQVADMIYTYIEPFAHELDSDYPVSVIPQGADPEIQFTYKFIADVLVKNKDGRPKKGEVKQADVPPQPAL